jgi:hypothetical protein
VRREEKGKHDKKIIVVRLMEVKMKGQMKLDREAEAEQAG